MPIVIIGHFPDKNSTFATHLLGKRNSPKARRLREGILMKKTQESRGCRVKYLHKTMRGGVVSLIDSSVQVVLPVFIPKARKNIPKEVPVVYVSPVQGDYL